MQAHDTAAVWAEIYDIVADRLNQHEACEGQGVELQHIIFLDLRAHDESADNIAVGIHENPKWWTLLQQDDTNSASIVAYTEINIPPGRYSFRLFHEKTTPYVGIRLNGSWDQTPEYVDPVWHWVNINNPVDISGVFEHDGESNLSVSYYGGGAVTAGWGNFYNGNIPTPESSKVYGYLHLVREVPATPSETPIPERGILDVRQNLDVPCLLEKLVDTDWIPFADLGQCKDEKVYNWLDDLTDLYQALWEQIYDGTPGSIHPSAPGDYFNGDDSANRNRALCIAAFDWFTTYAASWLNYWGVRNGALEAIVILLALFILPLSVAVGIIVASGLVYAFSVYRDAFTVQEAFREVVCAIVDELTGEAISSANFASAGQTIYDIYALDPGPESPVGLIAQVFRDAMADEKNYLSFVYELGKVYAAIQAGAIIDCPCEPRWRAKFDFENDSECGWSPLSPDLVGVYASGQGWKTSNAYFLGYYHTRCLIYLTGLTATARIRKVAATFSAFNYGQGFANEWASAFSGMYTNPLTRRAQGAGTYSQDIEIDREDSLVWDFRTNHGWEYGGNATCSSLTLEGVGTCPDEIISNATEFTYL